MLVNLGEWIKGWVSQVIVAGIAIVFIFWGATNFLISDNSQTEVATVNGEPISIKDFTITYQNFLQSEKDFLKQANLNVEINEELIKNAALNSLINEKVMLNKVKSNGYALSELLLQEELFNMPEFQEEGVFSQDKFYKIANQIGYDSNELLEKIKDSILLRQLPKGVNLSSFVLPIEAENLYKLEKQTRDFYYTVINATSWLDKFKITEDEIKEYYENHLSEFLNEEKISVEYVQLSLSDLNENVEVSAEEINDYYQNNIANYTQVPIWRASHILINEKSNITAEEMLNKLHEGASFASLAEKYSQDKGTADKGGDLGWFILEEMPNEFADALISLNSDLNISKPIKTNYGQHIIKLIDKKPETIIPLDKVSKEIRKILHKQAVNNLFAEKKEELSILAYENADSLQEISKQLSLPIHVSPFFSKNIGEEIAVFPLVRRAAFGQQVLRDNLNSDPIVIDEGRIIVLRSKQHKLQTTKSLSEAREDIIKKLKLIKSNNEAENKAKSLVEQLNGKINSLTEYKELTGLNWDYVKDATRDTKQNVPTLIDKAFSMVKNPKDNTYLVQMFNLGSNNYLIISLLAVKESMVIDKDKLFIYENSLANLSAKIELQNYGQLAKDFAVIETKLEQVRGF